MVRRWQIVGDYLHPVFSASRMQHADLHPKFALRPHNVRKYGRVDIESAMAENRRGKKKIERRKKKKPQGKI